METFEESLKTLLVADGLCVDCVEYAPETNGKPLQFVVGRDRYDREQKFQPDAVIAYMRDAERYEHGLRQTAAVCGMRVRKLYDLWERTSPAFKIEHRMLGTW